MQTATEKILKELRQVLFDVRFMQDQHKNEFDTPFCSDGERLFFEMVVEDSILSSIREIEDEMKHYLPINQN